MRKRKKITHNLTPIIPFMAVLCFSHEKIGGFAVMVVTISFLFNVLLLVFSFSFEA